MRTRILTDKERIEHTKAARHRYYVKNRPSKCAKSAARYYRNKKTNDKSKKEIQKLKDLIKELKAKPKPQPKKQRLVIEQHPGKETNSANVKTWYTNIFKEMKIWQEATEEAFNKVPECIDFKKGREEGIQKTIDMLKFLINDRKGSTQIKTSVKRQSTVKKEIKNPYGLKRRGGRIR